MADKKQEVFDEDLVAILHDEIHPVPETYQLEYLHIYSGTSAIPTATVRLRVQGANRAKAPPSATVRWTPFARPFPRSRRPPPRLERYEIRAVTSGTEAMGEVTVHLANKDRKVMGRGASTDVIEASAKAYVDGLNKLASLK